MEMELRDEFIFVQKYIYMKLAHLPKIHGNPIYAKTAWLAVLGGAWGRQHIPQQMRVQEEAPTQHLKKEAEKIENQKVSPVPRSAIT